MAYLVSILAVAVAVFTLTALAARTVRPARRTARSAQSVTAALKDDIGLLAARVAALRMEVNRRRGGRADSSSM